MTKDAKHSFGRLIDSARAELVVIAKRCLVVVMLAMEKFDHLRGWQQPYEKITDVINDRSRRSGYTHPEGWNMLTGEIRNQVDQFKAPFGSKVCTMHFR